MHLNFGEKSVRTFFLTYFMYVLALCLEYYALYAKNLNEVSSLNEILSLRGSSTMID